MTAAEEKKKQEKTISLLNSLPTFHLPLEIKLTNSLTPQGERSSERENGKPLFIGSKCELLSLTDFFPPSISDHSEQPLYLIL